MNKRLFDPEADLPDSPVEALILTGTLVSQLRLLWQTLCVGLLAGELQRYGVLSAAAPWLLALWMLLVVVEQARWRRTIKIGLARLHGVTSEEDCDDELEDEEYPAEQSDDQRREHSRRPGYAGGDPIRVNASDLGCVQGNSAFKPIRDTTD